MNSLDTRAATAEDGVGIVRVPSWQAEAWPARHPVRRLADDEPAAMPLHLMFQPKIRAAAG